VGKLPGPRGSSGWRDYYDEACHYSAEDSAEKQALVTAWIDELRPSSVWDLGANTGRFARLASSRGVDTIAFELDPFCVDEMYRLATSEHDPHLLPLVQDLSNPSPGLGWAGRERSTVTERGRADLALALALVHHLAIAGNVPLPLVVDRIAELADSTVIEWVPKTDPKVAQMLRSREDVFEAYSAEVLEAALEERFTNVSAGPLSPNGRRLYLARELRL